MHTVSPGHSDMSKHNLEHNFIDDEVFISHLQFTIFLTDKIYIYIYLPLKDACTNVC